LDSNEKGVGKISCFPVEEGFGKPWVSKGFTVQVRQPTRAQETALRIVNYLRRSIFMRRQVNLHPQTGRFLATPAGQKTDKMLREENRLGCNFEDDYKEKILEGDWGQKRFSTRWNVTHKELIFGRNLRGGRRSWVQMLNLPYREGVSEVIVPKEKSCEVCGWQVPQNFLSDSGRLFAI
jgi:hypothetical protein